MSKYLPQQQLTSPVQLGQQLRSARIAVGMTQTELAVRVGLSQKRVSSLELSPGSMTVEQLLAFIGVLDLELMVQTRGLDAPQTDW